MIWTGCNCITPGTMLELIARVNGRVIRRLVADHGRDDFEPAH